MEWTPEGIVHDVKVKDDPYGSEMLPFRDSHTELIVRAFLHLGITDWWN